MFDIKLNIGTLVLGLSGSATPSDYVEESALEIKETQQQVRNYLKDNVEKDRAFYCLL